MTNENFYTLLLQSFLRVIICKGSQKNNDSSIFAFHALSHPYSYGASTLQLKPLFILLLLHFDENKLD